MFRTQAVRLAAMLVLALPAMAVAQGKSRAAKGKNPPKATPAVTVVFRDADRPVMREYFRTNKIVAKPLPPGIAKNFARGKPLPPGIAKRAVPYRLVSQLPSQPGVTYIIAGDRVVALRQGVVVDYMFNIFD
jgi:hypothetical protein